MEREYYDYDIIGETSNKYPKSQHGFQCLGPCYKQGTTIVHPITLEYVTTNDVPFCPVGEWETKDKTLKITDSCYNITATKEISGKDFAINLLVPQIDFNEEQFLRLVYKIYSFEDAVKFVDDNKTKPLQTKLRVIDCAWKAYGKTVTIIDFRLVNFYIDLIKKKWINNIYKKFHKYVHVDSENDTVIFGDPTTNRLEYGDKIVTRTNFLLNRLINTEEIYKFLTKYIKNISDEQIIHPETLEQNLTAYIENKIKLTVGD